MFLSCILCNHYHLGPFDLVKAKAGNEEDDILKTGLSFWSKGGDAPSPILMPATARNVYAVIVIYRS